MGAVEPRGELLETTLGKRGVRKPVSFVEHAADARPHRLREVLEDVAALVELMPISA
jgi:hypothetical protein